MCFDLCYFSSDATNRRLLDSYRELQNRESLLALQRTRAGPTLAALVPVSFPETYPFTLLAQAPNSDRETTSTSTQSISESYFNCALAETAIVFLVIILSSSKKDIINFLEDSLEIEGKDNFAALMIHFFRIGCSLLDNEAFPSTWLNVNILAHKVLIKMADPIAALLERDFIPDQEEAHQFNSSLWREALLMLLKLLSSEQLIIEEFSPQV